MTTQIVPGAELGEPPVSSPVPQISFGSSLLLDVLLDQSVACGNDPAMEFDPADPFSVVVWVKRIGVVTQALVSYTASLIEGWEVALVDNKPRLLMQSGGQQLLVEAEVELDGDWHHVVFSKDGAGAASVTAYVDGVRAAVFSIDDGPTIVYDGTFDLNLGAVNGGVFFDGNLAGAAVYDFGLTPEQVTELYNGGALFDYRGVTPVPIRYWQLATVADTDGVDVTEYMQSDTCPLPNGGAFDAGDVP
jgi:hypothetical protein